MATTGNQAAAALRRIGGLEIRTTNFILFYEALRRIGGLESPPHGKARKVIALRRGATTFLLDQKSSQKNQVRGHAK